MYYRRQLPIMSGVYRPLETRRFVMMTMGGFWPVIQTLPNGHLGVVTRDGAFHIGERGRLVFVTSPDGGESWSHAGVISAVGQDNRNPAFGVAADGTLLAAFIKARYVDGEYDSTTPGEYPLFISRSRDCGATWTGAEIVQLPGGGRLEVGSPFGKMLKLPDGTMLLPYHFGPTTGAAWLIRSRDNGRTWVDPVRIAEGPIAYTEPALCHLGDGRLLVILRALHMGQTGLWQSDSADNGYTWSEPRSITGSDEHPGDVIRLHDGRLLLTYGRRVPPYGIQGLVSHDDGKTWDESNKILLVGDAGGADTGYPSSIQRDNGAIVTVYYSSVLHVSRRPRPEILGYHGAAVIYRPEDL